MIAFAFFGIEIRAITQDRKEYGEQQAAIRVVERTNFERVLAQNQKAFNKTVNLLNKTLQLVYTNGLPHQIEVNRKINAELKELEAELQLREEFHNTQLRGIRDEAPEYRQQRGMKTIGQANYEETLRYEADFNKVMAPKLVPVLREVLAATGQPPQPNDRQLLEDFGISAETAYSALREIQLIP